MVKISDVLIGVAAGILSGFGIGGGSLLVLYLTALVGISPYTAGGINLLYFICCAPAALVGHVRAQRIDWSAALWCTPSGIIGAVAASITSGNLHTEWLHRLFGILLICIAIKEWRAGHRN